jgi:hypothetical protein
MKTHALWPRHHGGAALTLLAMAGLTLAGCSTGGSGSTAGPSSPATSTSHGSAGTTSGAGGTGSSGGSTSVVSANSVPFPIAVGDTWKYNDTSNTVAGGTTQNNIVAVTPASDGQMVTMDSTITTTAGTVTHPTAYFVFHPDGSITYPFNQFSSSSTNGQVRLLSGSIQWPPAAQIDSGQPSHDTLKIEFIDNGQAKVITAHITVQGQGTQTVTVPAGTYSATVVAMTLSETIAGFAVRSEIKTWLASGVGPVQTQVILSEGGASHLLIQDQLTSFTKG